MDIHPDAITFHRDEPHDLVAAMVDLAARADGLGWVNLGPWISDEDAARLPVQSGLGAWFSGRGPAVSMATWTPAAGGRRPRPAQVGIEHGTGPNALKRLDELGLGLPSGWVKRQDHAKHGIVAELPAGAPPATVIRWMIEATTALRTVVEPGNRWTAVVHRPVAEPDR